MFSTENRVNIGVIEDDYDVIHYIINELDKSYNPFIFSWSEYDDDDYGSFRRYIESSKIDLFLIDVNLPGVSGFEVANNLYKARGEKVPIIYMSVDHTYKDVMTKNYPNLFLNKPLNSEDLNVAVDFMIEFAQGKDRVAI